MGHQLWVSTLTGYRRQGTRFTDLKQLFVDNVTAKTIYEPLLCCSTDSHAMSVKNDLDIRDFDIAGVKEFEHSEVVGYIAKDELNDGQIQKYTKRIKHEYIISDSTPIAGIINILSQKDFSFVISGNQITGIITKADINKPPVRIYLFGMISLFELHLNRWINHFYKENSWKPILSEKRMEETSTIFNLRKGKNQELTLLECLQLCDKRELLSKCEPFTKEFSYSKKQLTDFVKKVEKLRNELAHSQNSIISNLSWSDLVEMTDSIDQFLLHSDKKIEESAASGNDFKDQLF